MPDVASKLQQELDAAGGVVAPVHFAPDAVAYITRLAQQKDAYLAVRWQSEILETLEVDDALHQQGITVHLLILDGGNAK